MRETDHNLCRDLSKTQKRILKLEKLRAKVDENLEKELGLEESLKESMDNNELNTKAMVKRIQFDDHYDKQDVALCERMVGLYTPKHWRDVVEKMDREKKIAEKKRQRSLAQGKTQLEKEREERE